MPEFDRYDCVSPIDYRYFDQRVADYLSENAYIQYLLDVESALAQALGRRGLCSQTIAAEIRGACDTVTSQEVYAEEARIKHDIRALVNCIRNRVSDDAKRFVHMTATSYDIISSANAARFRDAMHKLVLPELAKLLGILCALAIQEKNTIQIGRTHGQHAVPITFGFAIAEYVSRLGDCFCNLIDLTQRLVGKFSGAVGAHNASCLFFDDPQEFERKVLAELELNPAEFSTQIPPPEPLARLMTEIILAAGVLANLARDMRNLQRTEIAEVGEPFEQDQVGSSTMPQKHNPINFENVESIWKIVVGRAVTIFLDQLSDHQRDLTNSASARTYGEIIGYFVSMVSRISKVMIKLTVNRENMAHNFQLQGDLMAAEPLQLILASLGHPDAHSKVNQLILKAYDQKKRGLKVTLSSLAQSDEEIGPYFAKMTSAQLSVINSPEQYTGIAAEKTEKIANNYLDIVADW